MKKNDVDSRYWDTILDNQRTSLRVECWRQYMKMVYKRLMDSWFQNGSVLTLKTDLFEEAFTVHSLLPEMPDGSVGLDYSLRIASAARDRIRKKAGGFHTLVCDLRHLPFRSDCFDQILSPSSLDHFNGKNEIDEAISELCRIMKPGGILILALDNPHNPVVWIRNHLPFSWLNRTGLVPYYVGPTCTDSEAIEKLRAAGMEVTNSTAVAHAPRLPAIWLSMLAEYLHSPRLGDWLYRYFRMWDVLEKWPFRKQTGYYIALRAVKCRK
jgi:SAM-dependent methyltransferase